MARSDRKRLRINVADLRKRLGQRRDQRVEVLLDPCEVLSSRTKPEPVTAEFTVESIERGVSVLGAVEFLWEGDCRRCLEPVEQMSTAEIDEIFQIDAGEDSEINDFDGIQIDMFPILQDAVGLALPLAPLCSDSCAGPDPDRYPAIPFDEYEREVGGESAPPAPDPRWAGLTDLKIDPD